MGRTSVSAAHASSDLSCARTRSGSAASIASSLRPLRWTKALPTQAGHTARGAFDGQRIGHAATSLDPGAAASQQPQPPVCVEISSVAGAMPDGAANLHLGLLIANAAEITTQHVITGDDDPPGQPGARA